MPRRSRAVALTPVLLSFLAPSAAGADPDQDLKNLYWEDAESFDDYADAVESNPTSSPKVRSAYNRNIQAVTAANKAYHSRCKR